MLKEAFAEDDYKERPLIDEQQKMENDLMLQAALHNGSTVEIKYYEDKKFKTLKGEVLFIDALIG